MKINTVQLQSYGYLINDVLMVPIDSGNRHYRAVLEWLAEGNVPTPEFTDEELLENAKQAQVALLGVDYIAARNANVTVLGNDYPADKDYQFMIVNLASRSGRGNNLPDSIRGASNVAVSLTPSLLDSIEDAIHEQVTVTTETLAVKTLQIEGATSVAEVQAITFTG